MTITIPIIFNTRYVWMNYIPVLTSHLPSITYETKYLCDIICKYHNKHFKMCHRRDNLYATFQSPVYIVKITDDPKVL